MKKKLFCYKWIASIGKGTKWKTCWNIWKNIWKVFEVCGVRGALGVRGVFDARGVFVLLLLVFSYWSVISLFIVCKFCGGIFLFSSFLFSMCPRTLSLWCWIRRFRSCSGSPAIYLCHHLINGCQAWFLAEDPLGLCCWFVAVPGNQLFVVV